MFELDEKRFLQLLDQIIGESEFVQNLPPKYVPEEDRVLRHVIAALAPYTKENGGVLNVKHIHFREKRGNLVVQYVPEGATKYVSFIGSHLDVVPANPETWNVSPFKLTVDGDKLYGRGTTDCLGHVALLTDLLCTIGATKPHLSTIVTVVFIASEENSSIAEVGVDMLMEHGHLNDIRAGPLFWIDTADGNPCIGTAGVTTWTLRAEGKLFHSGLPHKGINSIELAQEAIAEVQRRFYEDFPPHPEEARYNFASPSTLKPTQIKCSEGSLNQLPPWCEIQGDVRLTPFYNVAECMKKLESYVADINKSITTFGDVSRRGPSSKYHITEEDGNQRVGKVTITFDSEPYKGIACHIDSPGYHAICKATETVVGSVKPYSICGSLPLVGDLQAAGYDLQLCGYGKSSVYHGDNEYCLLSDMKNATKILTTVIDLLQ
eukprot:c6213_g1_i1.p1 GENE.c6213_g1_i1~~c6213_g1_i1.p1  ORF type:complete len:434 (-),score=107.52 c6213_g1_i1:33-1334(-)